MKKLWQKEKYNLDSFVESFETKGDLALDQKLIEYDVIGSLAQAKMLLKIGILSKPEFLKLEKGLTEILSLLKKGQFTLQAGDEDMHTKIENFLTDEYGEIGQKIHTGRSRNDQVLTALRLYNKDMLFKIEKAMKALIANFKKFDKKYGRIKMPGYTHMQKAMPSSLNIWTGSFIASLQDDLEVLKVAFKLNDQSPLGSAAGYGTSLPLDRSYSAKLLKFSKVQSNPLYCQNSRGKIEGVILSSLLQILLTINKFATDTLIFTTSEFKFFTASDSVTTGSSMMPQKKNLDLAELLRSKVHIVLGNLTQIVSLVSNLPSGYNRDFQDTKKALIESLETTLESIQAANILLSNLTPQKEIMEKALTEEIFATNKALNMTQNGVPFRSAYKQVAQEERG
ncbi:MAG: argininosuccinate lyase [Candidatus Daviesbacteria bacterium]|nr:argininosuccinate lyase [Candidatus Daviesbacteria bacterium]